MVVERLEGEVGDQPDEADDDDAEDDLAGVEQRLAVGDHVADAARRADQLGHDHVGPGPAQHQAQGLGDLGRRAGDQHPRDDALVARTQCVCSFHQVAPRTAHGDGHHQRDLEDRADEDDEDLLRLANARPQDQEWNEGRGRQVAAERNEGLEERLDPLVRAHRNAQRHGNDRRQDEATDDAPDGHADVFDEAVFGEQQPAFFHHGDGAGQEGGRYEAAQGEERPHRHEQGEKGQPEHPAGSAAHRLQRGQRAPPHGGLWLFCWLGNGQGLYGGHGALFFRLFT